MSELNNYLLFTLVDVMYTDSGIELKENFNLDPIVKKKHSTDAGMDLRACISFPVVLRAGGKPELFPVGLKFNLDKPGLILNNKGLSS